LQPASKMHLTSVTIDRRKHTLLKEPDSQVEHN
jgi:hypothetical protein